MKKSKIKPTSKGKEALRRRLEKKQADLDQLKKEKGVETALDRIRSRTLRMKSSEELESTAALVFKQLDKLKLIPPGSRTFFSIINKQSKTAEVWITLPDGAVRRGSHNTPLDKHPQLVKVYDAWKQKKSLIVRDLKGSSLISYLRFLKTLPHVAADKAFQKMFRNPPARICFTEAAFRQGTVGVMSSVPLGTQAEKTLIRFAKVFELAYTRFLDLQKAEAQAREAQIEAALERVRSRTMAMRKSEELAETSFVLFKQFKDMGQTSEQISIGIFNEEENIMELYSTLYGSQWKEPAKVSLDEPVVVKKIHAAWKEKKRSFLIDLTGDELRKYNAYRKGLSNLDYKEKRWVIHMAFFSKGVLTFSTTEPHPGETISLLERFAAVFDATYTRFQDLQNAEAHARESQIQLGLERVRARTMAMQKSDELLNVIKIIARQLTRLNFSFDNVSFGVNSQGNDFKFWLAAAGQPEPLLIEVPYLDNPASNRVVEARAKGISFFADTLSSEENRQWIQHIIDHWDVKHFSEKVKNYLLDSPGYSRSTFILKDINLYVGNYKAEPYTEGENNTFKRFAYVFEQAYTRFLDLQKAEVQAREKQIELGLERVRARTMAMHKSEELLDIIIVISKQLQLLNIQFSNVSFGVNNQQYDMQLWMAVKGHRKAFRIQWTFLDNPGVTRLKEAQNRPDLVFTDVLTKDENREWLQHIFRCNPGSEILSGKSMQFALKAPGYARSIAIMKNIFLVMGNYAAQPFANEENAILRRFANVFGQAYTRFLDLKKAEAQAREEQIEAALERVRSKTMAMHNSQEVGETVVTLFGELVKLGLDELDRCGIGIMHDHYIMEAWTASKNDGTDSELVIGHIDMKQHPLLRGTYEAWRDRKESFQYILEGDDRISYFNIVNNQPDYKARRDISTLPTTVVLTAFYFKEGGLYVFSDRVLAQETAKIFSRFAGLFGQTYRRYLDLVIAEAQAREAQIEAALEKIRSRSLAMHKSDELKEVIAVVLEKLKDLGLVFDGAGILLFTEGSRNMLSWVASPSQLSSPALINLPYDKEVFENSEIIIDLWKSRESGEHIFNKIYSYDQKNKFFDYVRKYNDFSQAPLDVRALQSQAPSYTYTTIMEKNSGLFADSWSEQTFSVDEYNILIRVARVFEQAYVRFLDLQKAEAQAREAQIEAALEKVRSRSLAMHKSDELQDVVNTVFERMIALNIDMNVASIFIFKQGSKDWEQWVASADTNYANHFHIPYTDNAIFNDLEAAKKSGKDFYNITYFKEQKNDWFNYAFINTEYSRIPEARKKFLIESEFYNVAFALSKNTGLQLAKYSGDNFSEKDKDILIRFSKVFEQAYIRFLDLQKAEAQAREAEIELALERIRAKSMAMQKSEELKEVIRVVYDQFVHLKINVDHAGFVVDYIPRDDWHFWIADKNEIPSKITHPYFDSIWAKQFDEAKEKGIDFFATNLNFEEKNNFYQDLFNYIPGLSEQSREFYFSCPGLAASNVLLENVALYIENFSAIPYTDEENKILMRFGKVFQQTYTRFLDLQKAEAQTREAQVEAALERVRSRTMGMQRSDELKDAAMLLFQQIIALGVPAFGSGFNIWDEDRKEATAWMAGKDRFQPPFKTSSSEDVFLRIYEAAERGESLFVEEQKGEAFKKHYEYMNSIPVFKEIADKMAKEGQSFPTSQIVHCAFFPQGYLMFITYEPVPFAYDIFKRFAKVFEQTYTRFLDLQKAEAQAREAQIEAALERVRSRSIAMRKSDEIADIAAKIFSELRQLDLALNRVLIWTFNDTEKYTTWWSANPEVESTAESYRIDYNENPVFINYLQAWQQRKPIHLYFLGGETKDNWSDFLFEHTEMSRLPEAVRKSMREEGDIFTVSVISDYGLMMSGSLEPLSDTTIEIIQRFGRVFQQSYTRYLDVQKAEAQAREAKIEAALEKVRAKAMAMHSSQDLVETISVFYRELKLLTIPPRRCGVALMDKVTRLAELTTMNTTEEGDSVDVVGQIKMSGHPVLDSVFENWLLQKEYHAVLRGNQIKEYYQVLRPQISFPDYPNDEVQYGYYFMFKEGDVYAWTDSELAEEHLNIYRRFASVISLTYKRYLDLQKAEAQAREARIEAALEKVRTRTMAMHTSDELQKVVAVVFERLRALEISMDAVNIDIFHEGSKDTDLWIASPGQEYATCFRIPYVDHIIARDVFEAKEKGIEFLAKSYAFEVKNSFFNHLFEHSDFKGLPPERKNLMLQGSAYSFSFAFTRNAAISIHSYSGKLFSDYENNLLKRFARVFEQTYTRFLDLQKAEAQAREATIEAALEKVRAKAMAMHNSNDLIATASLVFTEIKKLGIAPFRAGVSLQNKENRKNLLYSTTSSPEGDNLSLVGWAILEDHPVLAEIYDSWMRGEDYFPVLKGALLKTYYEKIKSSFVVPEEQATYEQYGCFIAFSAGMFYGWSEKPYTEDEKNILKRFASVIDLTFKRYFDLQKSEANAREAVKQAALDRIRADIASMRTISDLDRITPLIWNELTILGIPFIRCGVFIMDEPQKLIHTFLSTPEGKAIAAFHLPYDIPGKTRQILENWQKKSAYIDHWNDSDFLDFAHTLVDQNIIESSDQYLSTIPHGGFSLHFFPFLQGMLYVGNTTQLGEVETGLIQSVADAFSTAYARYEDFNKLEAAKQQVEKTLTDLKQAQQQLVQSEKMASLGELTAGIAHEIQNPLNFVNNFSEVNSELIAEMLIEMEKGNYEEANAISKDIKENEEKIKHHGRRADAIVKGMLQHSRTSSGQKEPTDINALASEYLNLAYHGMRARDKSFNAKFETNFDSSVGKINVIAQDIGRVVLNLINNAFYAVNERAKAPRPPEQGSNYEPTVNVSTIRLNGKVQISVKDNGNGIPDSIKEKIFQPFFTTKPTGQGTGLGLSLSYDIVKAHGGEMKVESEAGKGSEFIIQIPAN